MRVSIAIATWNRDRLIAQTLQHMKRLHVPPGVAWEIVIADNNSSDNTRQVVRDMMGELPLRYVYEPRQGVSFARNRAIAECTGDYILWTDDDVLVPVNWLDDYVEAFQRFPDYAFFGGPIEPYFEPECPAWLQRTQDALGSVYGRLDLGNQELLLPTPDGRLPYGANWAVRIDWQRRFLYDPYLGPKRHGRVSGAETDVLRRIVDNGGVGLWIPSVKIYHYIPRPHQTISHIRRYYFGTGRAEARLLNREESRLWFGIPRWTWRSVVENSVRYAWYRLTKPPEVWVPALVKMARSWGFWYECWKQRRRARDE